MALKVWLPLNEDLRNNGLSDLKFTNLSTSYTMIDTNGKFNKSFKNTSSSDGGLLSDETISLGQQQSMFCWFKFTSLISDSSLGGCLVTQHRYQKNQGMGITIRYVSSTTGYLSVNTGNGSSRTFNAYYGTTLLQANTWYHGGFTYDGQTIRIYVNGVCEKTQVYPNMSVPADYIAIFNWSLGGTSGRSTYGGYKLNGSLNDVRIYDHCLTEQEIKNIYLTKTLDLVNQSSTTFDRSGLLSSDIVKYNITTSGSSFYFNGSDAAIKIPFTDLQQGEFSMNTWFYKDSFGSKSWETIFGGPSGFELQTKRSSTASPVIAMYSWNNNAANDIPYSLNKWNMLTMTRTASGSKFYLNGELKQTGSTATIPSGNYFIGAWRDNNSQNYKGYVKEFSIFAKELQASEISYLYSIGPQTDVLPDGYTRLQYIQSTGSQYIDTNIILSTNKVKYEMSFEPTEISNSFCPFGTEYNNGSSNVRWGGLFYGYNKACLYIGSNGGIGKWNFNANILYNLSLDIDNGSYTTKCNNSASTGTYNGTIINNLNVPVQIFGLCRIYNNGTISHACYTSSTKMKLYNFMLTENDIMKFHGIPSKRNSDNAIGLYDIVTKTFFTNAGSGAFTAGPVI